MQLGDTITTVTADGTITGEYAGYGHIDGEQFSIVVKQGVHYDGLDNLTDVYLDDLLEVRVIPKYTVKKTAGLPSKIGVPSAGFRTP